MAPIPYVRGSPDRTYPVIAQFSRGRHRQEAPGGDPGHRCGGAMARLRVGVLISGRGSNLQALIEAAADPIYPAEIVLVISNRPEAPGLAHAAGAGIAHRVLAQSSREGFASEADALLRQKGAELVALAGFMRILDSEFVESWRDRLIN